MTENELKDKYSKVPNELKEARRWVCFITKKLDNGNTTKIPMNALTGKNARSNDKNTWTSFLLAIKGCIKYNFDGLGFMLGENIFGIDLDNHGNSMTKEAFKDLASEFVNQIKSYSEYSLSGEGVHIICKGDVPKGGTNTENVQIYNSFRFFAMTGNTMPGSVMNIEDCTQRITPLFDKYLVAKKTVAIPNNTSVKPFNGVPGTSHDFSKDVNFGSPLLYVDDSTIMNKIYASKNSSDFLNIYNGDRSYCDGDESRLDQKIMNVLCFWCNGRTDQMRRLFESSPFFKSKDEAHVNKWVTRVDYQKRTIEQALSFVSSGYTPFSILQQNTTIKKESVAPVSVDENGVVSSSKNEDGIINLDTDNWEIDINKKKVFNTFPLNDTGNAKYFKEYFGDNIRYNYDRDKFLIWNGKQWAEDKEDKVRKYADLFINVLKNDIINDKNNLLKVKGCNKNEVGNDDDDGEDEEEKDKTKKLENLITAKEKNLTRVSNKAGKDAMISELKHLDGITIGDSDLDSDDYSFNTMSGLVNLRTGQIYPHNRKQNVEKCSNNYISKKEPTIWLKFLNDIFTNDMYLESDTKDIVAFYKRLFGLCLSGVTIDQKVYFLIGNGGNGKSVLTKILLSMVGDYGSMAQKELVTNGRVAGINVENAIADLRNRRVICIQEPEKNVTLSTGIIKQMSGGDIMKGRHLYGSSIEFTPKFKPFMSMNSKPTIIDTDDGIWRRIVDTTFPNSYKGKEDIHLTEKLTTELPEITWWAIEGFIEYQRDGLNVPSCVNNITSQYREDMDTVKQFLNDNCVEIPEYKTKFYNIFEEYKKWAYVNHFFIMNGKDFASELEKKGFYSIKMASGKFIKGVKLISDKKGHAFGYDDIGD